jgi:hypothetical protein
VDTTFACEVCGAVAATIRLTRSELRRETFTGVLIQYEIAAGIEAALGAGDVRALFAVDSELAPGYCPECDVSYCGAHWHWWHVFDDEDPSWHDSIRGRCPRDHERMLED